MGEENSFHSLVSKNLSQCKSAVGISLSLTREREREKAPAQMLESLRSRAPFVVGFRSSPAAESEHAPLVRSRFPTRNFGSIRCYKRESSCCWENKDSWNAFIHKAGRNDDGWWKSVGIMLENDALGFQNQHHLGAIIAKEIFVLLSREICFNKFDICNIRRN